MKPLEIKKDIFWVGAVDYGCHNFHGYSIAPKGTTYNCYLIKDKKTVLFDTVQEHLADAMLCRLSQATDISKIDYIVLNHLELDHSGALLEILKRCKPDKIFCSDKGLKSFNGYFDTTGLTVQAVKTGDRINIGKRNVQFLETPMLHWPDSMFSYIPEDKLLISNDAFGQNDAASQRYADEVGREGLTRAIEEYYYNIILPFSPQVIKTLDYVRDNKLDIDMVAPDHGFIFRDKEDVAFIFNKYREMAEQKPKKKALIIYDTMWHSTEKMAYAVGGGLDAVGVPYRMMFLKNHHHSEVMTELARCGALIAGSPTHNNGILPNMQGVLSYVRGLRPQNRIGGAFGSFGWSGEAVKVITGFLEDMKMELPAEPVKCLFRPTRQTFEQAFSLGKSVGEALLAKID